MENLSVVLLENVKSEEILVGRGVIKSVLVDVLNKSFFGTGHINVGTESNSSEGGEEIFHYNLILHNTLKDNMLTICI